MKETKLALSPTCHLEMVEFETWPATLALEYTEHATDHWSSNTDTTIDLPVEKTQEIIEFLQKFVAATQPAEVKDADI